MKISLDRHIPAEALILDPKYHSDKEIRAFKERYEAEELQPLRYFLEKEGLESHKK